MRKAIICIGCSGSGKSTFATELCEKDESFVEINRDFIRFNIVQPGSDWGTYRFTTKRENEVSEIEKLLVMDAIGKERNLVLSNTNLNPSTRRKWIKLLEDLGYEVEIKEFPITLEEAYRRDRLRYNGVGQEVIYKQYQKWLEYKGRKTYTPNPSQPKAVILDVDGTIAEMGNGRSPYEWSKVGQDKPRQFIIDIARGLDAQGYTILVVSGRDMVCWDETKEWLKEHEVPHFYLFMREENDRRKDTVVKEEIFWDLIAEHWNVVGVLDDRSCMYRLWMELNIPNVLMVGNAYLEF